MEKWDKLVTLESGIRVTDGGRTLIIDETKAEHAGLAQLFDYCKTSIMIYSNPLKLRYCDI